jgi:hypothetical protein
VVRSRTAASGRDRICTSSSLSAPDQQALRINVEVRRRDVHAAIIGKTIFGISILELINSFAPTNSGTAYRSIMTIGTDA